MNKNNQLNIKSLIVTVFAVLSLLAALIFSHIIPESSIVPKMKEVIPEAQYFDRISSDPEIFAAFADDAREIKVGFIAVGEARGYGGPLKVVTGVNLDAEIVGTAIAVHKDTPLFIQMLKNKDFQNQFIGKSVTDPISIEKDINGVSGATYSSKGISMAVAQGSHAVAEKQYNLSVDKQVNPVNFGVKEITIIALILLAVIGMQMKIAILRWVTLIGSLIFIGFMFNTPASLGNIASLLMGYFPPVQEYLFWYLFMIVIPVLIFGLRKNVYCYWICPFGALQEIATKIGGVKFNCHKQVDTVLRKIKYVLAYLSLMIAFLFQSPGFAGYEPFAAIFGLQGAGAMWFILPIVLFTSIFINRFWCRYFCPVGVANELILKSRKLIDDILKRLYPKTPHNPSKQMEESQ